METCLLCLEIRKDFKNYIKLKSTEWYELKIQYLIEKHLWPMNFNDTFVGICETCSMELQQFHIFYCRIEEAHKNFGLFKKNMITEENRDLLNKSAEKNINGIEEQEIEIFHNNVQNMNDDDVDETTNNEFKDILDNLESLTEIQMNAKRVIKDEFNKHNPEDSRNNTQTKRKRGRPRKDDTNSNKLKQTCKYKTQNSTNISDKHNNHIDNVLNGNCTNEIKEESNVKSQTQESHISSDDCKETDFNNDSTDSESLESIKNKSKTKSLKSDGKEKDEFLAENFKITCFICNIPLETFFAMRKHFETNHNERGHVKCCNKKIYRRSILVDHVHRHLNPNYFKCQQCGKVMADRRCLELHLEMHNGNQEKIHSCDICGKGFAKLPVLKKHRMIHLSEEEKQFRCTECGKNFGSKYLLSSHHRYVHLKKYAKICDICGKSIRSKDVFERHMLQHEGKTLPSVNCDVCGLILIDKKALKRHKDMIHPEGGKQEYTCSICSKVSPNLRAHKRHVRYKHVMGCDHKCTICDKAFKKAQTLREHMASHTGTVLYTCPWCPKTFNSSANMHNHRKKVHPKEWEEASRKRYSGNLPPNFKPPLIRESTNFNLPLDL